MKFRSIYFIVLARLHFRIEKKKLEQVSSKFFILDSRVSRGSVRQKHEEHAKTGSKTIKRVDFIGVKPLFAGENATVGKGYSLQNRTVERAGFIFGFAHMSVPKTTEREPHPQEKYRTSIVLWFVVKAFKSVPGSK